MFLRLFSQSGLGEQIGLSATVSEVFDRAFDVLKITGHRDEYVYRAALSREMLKGESPLQRVSILSEFRVGSAKADLVILSRNATAYEIKSERDSLSRLTHQVESYRRVFAKVNVLTSECHIKRVLVQVPDDVGVSCLTRAFQIRPVREAADRPERICPVTVFDSLRMAERVAILQAVGVAVPTLPNTQRHAVLRELFSMLDPLTLHAEMLETLKRTRSLASLGEFTSSLPESLRAAALSVSIPHSDRPRLIEAMTTPLRVVMDWA